MSMLTNACSHKPPYKIRECSLSMAGGEGGQKLHDLISRGGGGGFFFFRESYITRIITVVGPHQKHKGMFLRQEWKGGGGSKDFLQCHWGEEGGGGAFYCPSLRPINNERSLKWSFAITTCGLIDLMISQNRNEWSNITRTALSETMCH